MKQLFLALLAICATGSAAIGAPPAAPDEEVRIPFAQFGAIRSFHAVGDDVVYLQGRRRTWYRAQLHGPCLGLGSALRIGLDQRYSATLDNSSTLIVDGERCAIQSITRSGPPPRRRRF
jgi:hypothetical protein